MLAAWALATYAADVYHASQLVRESILLVGASLSVGMLLGLAIVVLAHHLEQHVVTTERVINRTGILRRDVSIYPLRNIENVEVRQSLFGRLLGYGSVEIHTGAEHHGVGGRGHIRDPVAWQKSILHAMRTKKDAMPDNDSRSIEMRLRELERLRREGLIGDGEYHAKRRSLIEAL